MTLPTRSFRGENFFSEIRLEMAKNRGFYAARDGGLCYACMDATFYRLSIFRKDKVNGEDVKFSTAAKSAPGRVVVNGQWFNSDEGLVSRYCYWGPCSDKPWDGLIIVNGQAEGPNQSRFDNEAFWYFGQLPGRSQLSFKIGQKLVSQKINEIAMRDGLSPLTGVVYKNKRCALLAGWDSLNTPQTGKPFYGIHRASDVVFVVVQENKAQDGLWAVDFANRLVGMGVNDAVLGDGSDSVALVVDSTIEVMPGKVKDNTMRVGPMFTLQILKTQQAASKLTAAPTSTDPKFPAGTVLFGVSASFSQTNSGMQIEVLTFGATGTRNAKQVMVDDLELPPILTLSCPSSRLTAESATSFAKFTAPKTMASLRLEPVIDDGGSIVGTVTVNTSRGQAVFDAKWSLFP